MKKLVGFGAAMGITLGFALPAQAHWGPASPWVRQGQAAAHCTHSSPSRRVAVQVFRTPAVTECAFNPATGMFQCWDIIPASDDARVKNVSGTGIRADILLFGTDVSTNPAFPLPYIGVYQDVANNGTRWLSSAAGKTFWDLQASCNTSDNM